MKKRIVSLILAVAIILSVAPTAFAASSEETAAADALNELGLFNGTGTDESGKPIYELDRVPNRQEAVTMLVRLLGKDAEAKNGTFETPFTDVEEWAEPYVGYAYENGLTTGTSETTFGGLETVTATQYLTFVLRALGYSSSSDFQWDKAWELSDRLGITNGEYNASTTTFTRGDVVVISNNALDKNMKNGSTTLRQSLTDEGVIDLVTADSVTLDKTTCTIEVGATETLVATVSPVKTTDKTVTWSSSNETVVTVRDGVVTGVKEGKAEITATTTNGKMAKCSVTVNPKPIPATEVHIVLPAGAIVNESSYLHEVTMYVGDTMKLGTTISPSNANTNNTVDWFTLSTDVVNINSNGLVTAVGEGMALVSAYLPDWTGDDLYINVEKQTVKIILDDTLPLTLTYRDYRDDVKNMWNVTDFRYETTYHKYDDDYTAEFYLSGVKTYDANGSGQGDACRISWQLFDEDGYVVDSGTVYSPSVREGEKFKDAHGYIFDLKAGTYHLQLSSTN